ncbi:MAG: DUF4301 family protein [Bacteroidetes bacterium]|nr:DUF4301 family protein [Bacteroidota bacterium]
MFSQKDLKQIKEKKISETTINHQVESFKNGFPFIKLVDAATPVDGIKVISKQELDFLARTFDVEISKRNVIKFVPASGAASRMFKNLFTFREKYNNTTESLEILFKDQSPDSIFQFFYQLKRFAFYEDLKNKMFADGIDIETALQSKDYNLILDYLLTDKGLNYGEQPKALLKFHQYSKFSRTAIEEHLVEGAIYCKDFYNNVNIHFTVSPEHLKEFESLVEKVRRNYENLFDVKFSIGFSVQKSSTDTIAVDMENNPFREKDGSLLFRPGGHGALIENLNDLHGDIIFIKNIDNIVPDQYKETTSIYKKAIGKYLIDLQAKTFDYLKLLENEYIKAEVVEEIIQFAANELYVREPRINELSLKEKIVFLFDKLNRPMRICGMVKNEGEPGGGPFWVKNAYNEISLQVVESSQVDLNNPKQKEILTSSTHFNPVDLVCCVRDYKGICFNLPEFVDHQTGFISAKSKDGKDLKALELPGLWNGAMADWITVFVEVPLITFNPVKTVNDLLRKEHQIVII